MSSEEKSENKRVVSEGNVTTSTITDQPRQKEELSWGIRLLTASIKEEKKEEKKNNE